MRVKLLLGKDRDEFVKSQPIDIPPEQVKCVILTDDLARYPHDEISELESLIDLLSSNRLLYNTAWGNFWLILQ